MASAGAVVQWRDRRSAEGISRPTVTKWRNRFAERRLEGLVDEPRPGQPRTITDEQVEAVVITTLESAPKDATHWSTRSMASEVGMTPDSVMRIWHAFGLQPHRQQTLEALQGPAVDREGPRHLRPVPEPARARGGAVRGREEPDPSARQDSADAADAARHSGVISLAPGMCVAIRRGSRVSSGREVTAACAPMRKSGRIASRVPPARR